MEVNGLSNEYIPKGNLRSIMDNYYDMDMARRKVQNAFEDETTHIHKTAQDRDIPLYKMDDSHLINTISYHARNIANAIQENGDISGPESMLDAVMMGKHQRAVQLDNIKRYISDGYQILGRYMVEALRRGLAIEAMEGGKPYFEAINQLAGISPKGEELPKIQIKEMQKDA
jgi:hypothetical protein